MNLKTLIAALALASCGATLAADPPAAPSATPVKHPSLKSCNRDASAKQLAGKPREQFVKQCMAAKTQPAPPPAPGTH